MKEQDGKSTDAETPESTDRREFIRKSFGAAPLMLTLGSRSYGGGTSMHGTLWSSLGTKWKHKGDWWRFKKDGWRWTKSSGDHYREKDDRDYKDSKKDDDWSPNDKIQTKPKDWDWDKSDERWQREMEAEAKRKDSDRNSRSETPAEHGYDWREDEQRKRMQGLSSFDSDRSHRKKD